MTTPEKISNEIIAFCKEIDSTHKPLFIPVKPTGNVRFNYCMTDVPKFVEKNGGCVKYGWTIWEVPYLFLEAEFHAVWLNKEGELIDLTPKPDGEKQILYLQDSIRIFNNQLVDNIRKPQIDNWVTGLWIIHGKVRFQIRKFIFKAVNSIKFLRNL